MAAPRFLACGTPSPASNVARNAKRFSAASSTGGDERCERGQERRVQEQRTRFAAVPSSITLGKASTRERTGEAPPIGRFLPSQPTRCIAIWRWLLSGPRAIDQLREAGLSKASQDEV